MNSWVRDCDIRIKAAIAAVAGAGFTLCFSVNPPEAQAGSITANTGTYAGDVSALNFPVGTVAGTNYTAYRNGGTFYDSDGVADPTGNVTVVTDVTRIDWIATMIRDMPFVVSVALPYGYVDNATLEGQDQTVQSSFFSPNIFLTLGAIVDPQNQRTLALSNYFFFPAGNYDSAKTVNIATPGQTVIAPQFAYEEGLGKFSPELRNFWIDVFGGAAFHSDGDNPVTIGGLDFDRTEQDHSYNINLYLRSLLSG